MIIDVKLQLVSLLFEASEGQARKGKMADRMYDQSPTCLYESTTLSGLMLGLEQVRVYTSKYIHFGCVYNLLVGLVSN